MADRFGVERLWRSDVQRVTTADGKRGVLASFITVHPDDLQQPAAVDAVAVAAPGGEAPQAAGAADEMAMVAAAVAAVDAAVLAGGGGPGAPNAAVAVAGTFWLGGVDGTGTACAVCLYFPPSSIPLLWRK